MKPLTVTAHGLTLTLMTTLAGHAYLCNAKTQAITETLVRALEALVVLAEDDPRGYKE